LGDVRERRAIGRLAVEMDRQDGTYGSAARSFEGLFDGLRGEIKGGRINIRQDGGGAGAEDSADRGEEAEGGGNDRVAGPDFCSGEGKPQRICA